MYDARIMGGGSYSAFSGCLGSVLVAGLAVAPTVACDRGKVIDLRQDGSTIGVIADAAISGVGVGGGSGGEEDGRTADTQPADGPTERQAGQFAGRWVGLTSQGLPLEMIHDGFGIVEWRYGWMLPACASTTTTTFPVGVPVADDGTFMRALTAGAGGMSTMFQGRFTSDTECTGTIMFELKAIPGVPSCSGRDTVTFTASKQ